MLGRAFHYSVGALAEKGPPHLIHILTDDMRLAMGNIGARRLSEVKDHLIRG
jgi:L-lactate dehydrogenase (cytochrome)